ncbi:MAG TPA: 30S ribosomal protein S7 [Nitrospiria bacterium]
MSRKGTVSRRDVSGDPRYNDKVVRKMINVVMREGKRSVAEKVCYQAMDLIKEKTGNEPLKVFKTAVDNIRPMVEVKSRRVGGASYQVPVDIRPARRMALALRWLTTYARKRSGKSMKEKLAGEILDASNSTGGAIKKKEDTHRMAEANKAFAHYRW